MARKADRVSAMYVCQPWRFGGLTADFAYDPRAACLACTAAAAVTLRRVGFSRSRLLRLHMVFSNMDSTLYPVRRDDADQGTANDMFPNRHRLCSRVSRLPVPDRPSGRILLPPGIHRRALPARPASMAASTRLQPRNTTKPPGKRWASRNGATGSPTPFDMTGKEIKEKSTRAYYYPVNSMAVIPRLDRGIQTGGTAWTGPRGQATG